MKVLLFLLTVSAFTSVTYAVSDRSKRPNVLFVVIDDLRPKLGCYGEDMMVTPNIDQLASQSMKFTNAHVQQAVCAPSRVSFLTGRRPDTTRLYDFGSYWRVHAGNYTTIPQYFKEAGYFSAGVGKVFHQAVCAPSRVSFLTGRRPDTTRLYDFGSYWRDAAGNYTTLPQYFKEAGYFAAGVGKVFHKGIPSNNTFDYPYSWSIPNYWPSTEQYQGQQVCITPEGKKHNLMCPVDVSTQPEGSLPDIQNADYAIELLGNISSGVPYVDYWGNNQTMKEPFFVGLGFRKPHVPYKYPEDYKKLYPLDSIKLANNTGLPAGLPSVAFSPYLATLNNYQDIHDLNLDFPYGPMPKEYQYLIRQSYYASVSFMDYQVGRVLSALDDYGFSDNTIISFVGDHGWQLGEHSEFSKFTNYRIATNVPLLIHVPGVTDKGRRSRRSAEKFPLIDALERRRKRSTDQRLFKPSLVMPWGGDNADIYSFQQTSKGHTYSLAASHHQGPSNDAFAELVDLFPTISDLAGLTVPNICPSDSLGTDICREGVSLAPIVRSYAGSGNITGVKSCIISQYPRPTVLPSHHSILPSLNIIKIMGYSMRTDDYRYSEWVGFDHKTFKMDWTNVFGRELYILAKDPQENNNLAYNPAYLDIAEKMSEKLHKGWRDCIL